MYEKKQKLVVVPLFIRGEMVLRNIWGVSKPRGRFPFRLASESPI